MAELQAPGANTIADRLWEHQLRREHQIMLKQIREVEAQRDADLAEYRRSCEDGIQKYIVLQSRIEELERAQAEWDRTVEEHEDRIAELKNDITQFLTPRISAERLEEIVSIPATGDYPIPPPGGIDSADELRSSIETSFDNVRKRLQPRLANRQPSNLTQRPTAPPPSRPITTPQFANAPSRTPTSKELFKKPNVPAGPVLWNPTTNSRKRPTTTRPTIDDAPRQPPVRRSRSTSTDRSQDLSRLPQPLAPPSPVPVSIKIPKLSQGRRPLKSYYDAATVIHTSLQIKDEQAEHDFANAFISGILDKKTAAKLVDTLQQFCLSQNRADGSIEILCGWDEVIEGLQKAGMDDIEQTSHDKEKNREAPTSATGLGFRAAVKMPASKQSSASRGRLVRRTVPKPTASSRTASPVAMEKPTTGKTRAAQSSTESSNANNGRAATSKFERTKASKAVPSSITAPKAGTGKEKASNSSGGASTGTQGGKRGGARKAKR